MAMIGYLGKDARSGIQFVVSREVFRTPKDMKWGGSARYSTHARHNTHALTEFTGLDPDFFSFEMLLTAELGVNPLDEVVKIWEYEREGEALGLVIGGHAYGKHRWTIQKHETRMEYTDGVGDLYAVEVSVTLLEYLKGADHNTSAAQPAATAPPTTTGTGGGGGTSGGRSGSGSGARTYTVKKGDCMWNIALHFYGDGTKYMKIYEANRNVIGGNPAMIYPGQVLTIPE